MIFERNTLFLQPEGVETRWASTENPKGEKGKGGQNGGGRKGSPCFPLKSGEQRVLAEAAGVSGTIWRIWATVIDRSPEMLRGLRLDFYWDGAQKPAVSSPFGDFFGVGLGLTAQFESALFTNPEGKSFVCYVPMPFKTGMRLVVTNERSKDLDFFFYDVDYTIGDRHGDDMRYFHAHYCRENATMLQRDYEILPKIYGRGRFLGCNIGVNANSGMYYKTWWGEGEAKIYLDGDDEYPTLCGTGTEDYIGTGWGQGRYDNLYQGSTVSDSDNMKFCFYRYHIPDPVYFSRDIRVTMQQIGGIGPDARPLFNYNGKTLYSTSMEPLNLSKTDGEDPFEIFERSDDWSSCAYFYLDRPENELPEIDGYEKRID